MRLICLISAQSVPNLVSVLHLSPHTVDVVLTHKMQTEGRHAHFVNALQHLNADPAPAPSVNIWEVDNEDDVAEIEKIVMDIHAQCRPAEQLVINLTGGTKLMTLGAFQAAHSISTSIRHQ